MSKTEDVKQDELFNITNNIKYETLIEALSRSDLSVKVIRPTSPTGSNSLNFFRWRDVWKDKLYFKQSGKTINYRAIAISTPAIAPDGSSTSVTGYIVGIRSDAGKSSIQSLFELRDVKWVSQI